MRRNKFSVVVMCVLVCAVCFGYLSSIATLSRSQRGVASLNEVKVNEDTADEMEVPEEPFFSEVFPSDDSDSVSYPEPRPVPTHSGEDAEDRPNGQDTWLKQHDRNAELLRDRTFSHRAYHFPNAKNLEPRLDGYLAKKSAAIRSFLQEDLHNSPNRSGLLSRHLRTSAEVTREAQRLHFDILARELRGFKYAMLFDIASFENKGDPCITVGEIYFLARIKLKVVHYCSAYTCNADNFEKAAQKAKQYSPKELVILNHGGGNFVGYNKFDYNRFTLMKLFKNYRMFVFPQSIYIPDFSDPFLQTCRTQYCCNENVTIVLRDRQSFRYAMKYFKGGDTKFLMAPDMAFQIGPVNRFLSPVFDVMWIKRHDSETPGYKANVSSPPGIRVHVSDWKTWPTPGAPNPIEKAHYVCTNGFFYLQRGRVIITDRLHGHILATLMDIPHVLIDNKERKLSAYHYTWTKDVENTVITDDPAKALTLALNLIERYNSSIPPRVPYLQLDEKHGKDKRFDKVEISYA